MIESFTARSQRWKDCSYASVFKSSHGHLRDGKIAHVLPDKKASELVLPQQCYKSLHAHVIDGKIVHYFSNGEASEGSYTLLESIFTLRSDTRKGLVTLYQTKKAS